MDAEFQKYLENFNEIVKQNEEQKFKLKKYFFYCVMIILFLVIIFPYILVFVFHEKVTDVTVITMGISSTAEVVSSIIVLPKIIAKYEYYGAAEPPVRCGESHLSGLTEPLRSL